MKVYEGKRVVDLRLKITADDDEELQLYTKLCNSYRATVGYDIFKRGLREYHRENSIGLEHPQRELFEGHNRA